MKSKGVLTTILLVSYMGVAQEKNIKGKIIADGNNVSGINLVNLINEKTTITDEKGEFSILAKEDDLLVFSAENFYYKRKIIDSEDLKKDILIIEMEPKPIELEEVVIQNFSHLTAYNLGIINYIPKQYSVAERRMISGVGSAKENKARLENERKLAVIDYVDKLFDDEYFVKTLKINSQYLQAFKIYFSEDIAFRKLVNAKVKNNITLAIIDVAREYNALQTEEITKE